MGVYGGMEMDTEIEIRMWCETKVYIVNRN